jgi:hypothetical protein
MFWSADSRIWSGVRTVGVTDTGVSEIGLESGAGTDTCGAVTLNAGSGLTVSGRFPRGSCGTLGPVAAGRRDGREPNTVEVGASVGEAESVGVAESRGEPDTTESETDVDGLAAGRDPRRGALAGAELSDAPLAPLVLLSEAPVVSAYATPVNPVVAAAVMPTERTAPPSQCLTETFVFASARRRARSCSTFALIRAGVWLVAAMNGPFWGWIYRWKNEQPTDPRKGRSAGGMRSNRKDRRAAFAARRVIGTAVLSG